MRIILFNNNAGLKIDEKTLIAVVIYLFMENRKFNSNKILTRIKANTSDSLNNKRGAQINRIDNLSITCNIIPAKFALYTKNHFDSCEKTLNYEFLVL